MWTIQDAQRTRVCDSADDSGTTQQRRDNDPGAVSHTVLDGRYVQLCRMATTTQDPRSVDTETSYELIQPFSEAAFEKPNGHDRSVATAQWAETVSPFTEAPDRGSMESEADRLMGEALDELRDEGFDEAVAILAEETEQPSPIDSPTNPRHLRPSASGMPTGTSRPFASRRISTSRRSRLASRV